MCCGSARTNLGQRPTRPTPIDRSGADGAPAVQFTYTGRTSLAVLGGATRTLYRFEGTGATLAIDRRDALGLAAVPLLQRVGEI